MRAPCSHLALLQRGASIEALEVYLGRSRRVVLTVLLKPDNFVVRFDEILDDIERRLACVNASVLEGQTC